ncbi:hypothetical protein [Clostridium saccharobutylicum]|uniref:Uncharacterized protein n=1 Tax=Clostridium saccharobutylicum TaxID=169679 RepID=A0A1S8NJV7_CLOSA|nr:hypothetical protein [Clostridium saccharobutylicum]OOM16746.1 hypothetical protein CLOSAC_10400 [Clostridium saccharobutylicum]
MDDKAKEAKRAYMKKWRKNNKDKVKEHQERYWTKKAEHEENKLIEERN